MQRKMKNSIISILEFSLFEYNMFLLCCKSIGTVFREVEIIIKNKEKNLFLLINTKFIRKGWAKNVPVRGEQLIIS